MKTRVFAVCVVVFLFCGITHAGLSDGLVAYYPFNGNANDESGNGHTGIVHGATLTADRFGKANSAYAFGGNGANNYIDLLGTENLNSTLSLSAWVNFTANSPNNTIIGKHICGVGTGFLLGLLENSFYFDLYENPVMTGWMKTSEKYNDGKFHFIVGVYDGTTQFLYVDGALKRSEARIYTIKNSLNTQIGGLAQSGCQSYFAGSIDDVRIYSRAISASEIQQLYEGQGTCSSNIVTFTAGTPAKAADVNANFDALKCQNQALNSQFQALKAIVCKNDPTSSVCQ